MKIEIPVVHTFSTEDIAGYLEGATMSSSYWCSFIEFHNVFDGKKCVVKDIEGDKIYRFDQYDVEMGLRALAKSKEYFRHFSDLLTEDDDGTTYDVLLQFILFKKVKYG